MLRRWIAFGLGFALLSLPISYMVVTSKGQVWLIVPAIYFVIGALVGNWYVPFAIRFDMATFWRWLALNAFAAGAIALAYLNITGVVRF